MDSEQSNLARDDFATDVNLWLALKAGQTDALGKLYDRHSGLVYGVALRVLGTAQEAEDLTQDIFIKLMQSSAYDPKRGSLRTFLAILTRSRAIDRLRSRQVAQTSLQRWQSDYAPPSAIPPVDEIARDERSQAIRDALASLTENQQEILRMAYYDGLTQSTIAKQLDTPLGTVKARARRGLLKLRQLLQDSLD
ncbi:MAG: sigma-70 family RNA polymerase sigma factor [Leptolyngbyaceae cyanobacterium SM1_1_3]|nr:sigma-70 family RNA polymerase sigma factor [Leptolyngbyaceae cyanobacterium SM1_1_3]NJN04703.1 sigma-70 family RNA polymerase sigma factor [Leptolyngbyaceae cyanobacterium RM1_1_2]NJO11460.1 sigma-70 family RNA polymerase sigma factor [Leptolyngbyaceae cyanobacterium SL_1_1]